MRKNWFKTKNRLRVAIDYDVPGIREYLDEHFFNLFEIEPEGLCHVPYWLDEFSGDEYYVEYREGFWIKYHVGDRIEHNGDILECIDHVNLPEEIEHQTDDGGIVYEYRGPSHLAVFKKIETKRDKL